MFCQIERDCFNMNGELFSKLKVFAIFGPIFFTFWFDLSKRNVALF